MRTFVFSILAITIVTGCVSRQTADLQAIRAYETGKREATASQQKPAVYVVGNVRNHSVPWAEDLTLARAVLAAEYQGSRDPREIYVTRQGQQHKIDVRKLLNGTEDPQLDAGDVVDIR